MKTRSDQPIETLRLSDRDKAKLLWAIDQAENSESKGVERRLRVTCTNNEAVLTLKSDGGGETKLSMLTRNLSRMGAALVHGRYIHPDSRCELSLPTQSGVWQNMLGTVVHIRHIQGTIHELGVMFDAPIDLSEFVCLSASEETQYLRELADDMPEQTEEDVDQLASRVLVVDDFSSDRKLFSHWLTQAGLTVTTCGDSRSAHVQVQEQIFDLLIVDCCLGAESGVDLVKELRQSQVTAPIISVSADESPELLANVKAAGANDFLKKPFSKEQVVNLAYDLIGIDASTDLSPIFSVLKDDSEMRPLLTEFTRKLSTYIDDLREANAQSNYDVIENITRGLKGAGEGYGFPEISTLAGELLQSLAQEDAEIESIRQSTNDLITILNRVKLN